MQQRRFCFNAQGLGIQASIEAENTSGYQYGIPHTNVVVRSANEGAALCISSARTELAACVFSHRSLRERGAGLEVGPREPHSLPYVSFAERSTTVPSTLRRHIFPKGIARSHLRGLLAIIGEEFAAKAANSELNPRKYPLIFFR